MSRKKKKNKWAAQGKKRQRPFTAQKLIADCSRGPWKGGGTVILDPKKNDKGYWCAKGGKISPHWPSTQEGAPNVRPKESERGGKDKNSSK